MQKKRTDVGYGRPPVETRFKKGHKPPPRKKKEQRPALSAEDAMWRVLQSPRRVGQGRKAQWVSNAELLVRRAFQLAETESPVLARLLIELTLLETAKDVDQLGYRLVMNPDAPASSVVTEIRTVKVRQLGD